MDRRILIIEDNETNLELMVYLLQEFGYTPISATDGAAGLALIKIERPDLVLCDLQLPMIDGYEVARRMKADPELRAIPIVAVSALAMVGDREKALAAGFNGYISKPIEPKTFVQQVGKFLGVTAEWTPTLSSPKAVADRTQKKGFILVVDDLLANITLFESLLQPQGYEVVTTNGMTEAMALARKHLPDLIISDVRMHEGDGYQLCEALKTETRLKDIPLILITSTYCNEGARQKGLALGAAEYLFRPIESKTLLSEIEKYLPEQKS